MIADFKQAGLNEMANHPIRGKITAADKVIRLTTTKLPTYYVIDYKTIDY
jgi:hypothetical protein